MASCSSFGFSDQVSVERTTSSSASRVEMTQGDYGSVFIVDLFETCNDVHCGCVSDDVDLQKADLENLLSSVMKVRKVGDDEILTEWPGHHALENSIEFLVLIGTTDDFAGNYEAEIELTFQGKVQTIKELVAMTFKEEF